MILGIASSAVSFNPRTRVGCDYAPQKFRGHNRAVSIHAPAWGATHGQACRGAWLYGFNPRTRVGCDFELPLNVGIIGKFQSTHPRGVRRILFALQAAGRGSFNPRTRVGCDMSCGRQVRWQVLFQSTHPRGVRHLFRRQSGEDQVVSIHAPAWGATSILPRSTTSRSSFNPRTRVGCDGGRGHRRPKHLGFNPRTRVGCDMLLDGKLIFPGEVSIHAPAWGATHGVHVRLEHGQGVSIHAPAWGATADAAVLPHEFGVSIHAPAWGATGQPDAPGGAGGPVSIHAPAWGATMGATRVHHQAPVSIHAPAWGATALLPRKRPSRPGFNPRTRVGCDAKAIADKDREYLFQSTHPRGVRRRTPHDPIRLLPVSIHAPAWGATAVCSIQRPRCGSFNPRTRVGCDGRPRDHRPCRAEVSIHAPAWGATVSMFYPVDSRD